MGRVTAESSRGQTQFYEYDLAGNRVKATYSTGRVVQTTYDALNRPETISEGGRLTQYGYDLAGRACILIAGNGQTSQNSYDALGRLTDRTLFRTSAMSETEVLAQFEWEHDLLGNVTAQHETWPGDANGSTTRRNEIRSTVMTYDDNNRLLSETIQLRSSGAAQPVDQSLTEYSYDAANNRATKTVTRITGTSTEAGENEIGHWEYTYNNANQLTGWEKLDYPSGSVQKSASLSYDEAGNRTSQTVTQAASLSTTSYAWDAQDRLASVTMPDGSVHSYEYDYRTRRIGTTEGMAPGVPTKQTAIVFSGGLSVAEWESTTNQEPGTTNPSSPTVEYTRGPDMGGGVGGMLYSMRSGAAKYSLSNGRGDIVAQADQSATLTWTASYEAYGKRTKETGTNLDKQRGNSKDEDPTGLLNEGFRYRDIETGVWLSRDPAGFVDGPNLYAYVQQNPWSHFDPNGLWSWSSFGKGLLVGAAIAATIAVAVVGAPAIATAIGASAAVSAGIGAAAQLTAIGIGSYGIVKSANELVTGRSNWGNGPEMNDDEYSYTAGNFLGGFVGAKFGAKTGESFNEGFMDGYHGKTSDAIIGNLLGTRQSRAATDPEHGDATFSQASGDGRMGPITESARNNGPHAEPQALEGLGETKGPVTVGVDSTPCAKEGHMCSDMLNDTLPPGSRVVVPSDGVHAPKSSAVRAVEDGTKVLPKTHSDVPLAPRTMIPPATDKLRKAP